MIGIGAKRYFVFPWADGGNLSAFWKDRDSHEVRSRIACRHIPDIMAQLAGLASALVNLHNFKHSKSESDSYRHGDLKPENILLFGNKHANLSIWKLADLGLAKYHIAATQDRNFYPTSKTGGGTISYQPPESVSSDPCAPTSRLYDIWSMGCIILQLLTWLLYGTGKINDLTENTKSVFTHGKESSYWTASWSEKRGFKNVDIHPVIKKHMQQMKRDLKGSNALMDLLLIIQNQLLVIDLPPNAGKSKPGCRSNAKGLLKSLKAIQTAGKRNHTYWISDRNLVKQASTLQLPQRRSFGIDRGNNVSSNSSITSLPSIEQSAAHFIHTPLACPP